MTIDAFLTNLCHHCGFEPSEVQVELSEDEETLTALITVPTEESGLLIGHHGDTLAAMQRITRIIFQEELGEKKLIVNVNDYREQRTEKVVEMAQRAAQRVLESGRPYTFSHLPSHERFIIHTTISNDPSFTTLESFSEGEPPYRVLVIRAKESS